MPLLRTCLTHLTRIGELLRTSYKAALGRRNLQVEGYNGFTNGLPAKLVEEWVTALKKWENAPFPKAKNAKNPYLIEELCKSARFKSLLHLAKVGSRCIRAPGLAGVGERGEKQQGGRFACPWKCGAILADWY